MSNLKSYEGRRLNAEYLALVRKNFADIVFLPRKGSECPAMIIELKYDKSAKGAIQQIKDKKYVSALKEYHGNLLLVGINYDRKTKKHCCEIEKFEIV